MLQSTTPRAQEPLDFRGERRRHAQFFGREDVLQAIDAWQQEPTGYYRYLLLTGSPGLGKSAILSAWLTRAGQTVDLAPHRVVVPHHLIRADAEDWCEPTRIVANLVAQIESMFPQHADPEAQGGGRLRDLLERVSCGVLVPEARRLVLVIDGLDEARPPAGQRNPLPMFLPHYLPPGVFLLCASRPTYPYLTWFEARDGAETLDLSSERWRASRWETCREFWTRMGANLKPALEQEFLAAAVVRSEGNVLHAVRLYEQICREPPEQRNIANIPRGLRALLEGAWQGVMALAQDVRDRVVDGLGVLVAARSSLSLQTIEELLGWSGVTMREEFLRAARPFLLEEPGQGPGPAEPSYRCFHESLRQYLAGKLPVKRYHEILADIAAAWFVAGDDSRRDYAVRHGVLHCVEAGRAEAASGLVRDLRFMRARLELGAVGDLEGDLMRVASALTDSYGRRWHGELAAAVRRESHWLRERPETLARALYNRLLCSEWTDAQIIERLVFPSGPPKYRLRHRLRLSDRSQRTLHGHNGHTNAITIFPDGRRCLSASSDRTLRVWDMDTGEQLLVLQGHTDRVKACAVTPNGRRAISTSTDSTLRIWDLASGVQQAQFHWPDELGACAVTSDGRRAICLGRLSLYIIDLDVCAEGPKIAFSNRARAPQTCAIHPDGRLVLYHTHQGFVAVDLSSGEEVRRFVTQSGWVTFTLTPDGRRLVAILAQSVPHAGLTDVYLKVWEFTSAQELLSIQLLRSPANQLGRWGVASDGRRVFVAALSPTILVLDLDTGRRLSDLAGHASNASVCAISRDGGRLVSADCEHDLKVWSLEPVAFPSAPVGEDLGIMRACAMAADGSRSISVFKGALRVYDAATRQERVIRCDSLLWASKCAFMGLDRAVIVASTGIFVLHLDSDEMRQVFAGSGTAQAAIVPDGQLMVHFSSDFRLRFWDLSAEKILHDIDGHDSEVVACAITPDGRRAVSRCKNLKLKVWDLHAGREVACFNLGGGNRHFGEDLAVTPDGRHAITTHRYTCTLAIHELASGEWTRTLKGHTQPVEACAVTLEGDKVVSASIDQTLRIWKFDTGECLDVIPGVAKFRCIAATADNIVAGDDMGNLWMLASETGPAAPAQQRRSVGVGAARERLVRLLAELFTVDEMRRFLRNGAEGTAVALALPGPIAGPSELASAAVAALERHGIIDDALFEQLRESRQGRRKEIDDAQRLWNAAR